MMVDSSCAGRFVSGDHLLAGRQIRGHAAALVAELRLDDDRQADFLGGDPSVFGVFQRRGLRAPARRRPAAECASVLCLERSIRRWRRCDRFRRRECAVAANRSPSCTRLPVFSRRAGMPRASAASDDRRRAGAKRESFGKACGASAISAGHVERLVVHRRQTKQPGRFQRGPAERFLLEFDGNFINAFFQRFPRAAEADFAAGQRLQLQARRVRGCAPARCRGGAVRRIRPARRRCSDARSSSAARPSAGR